MPFTAVHHYISVIGDAYASAERWQFGLRVGLGNAVPGNAAIALALSDDVSNWWSLAGGQFFGSVQTHRLVELKVATIDTDGEYLAGTYSASHFYVPPIQGGTLAPPGQVAQNSIVATLTTAIPRGLASKGRIYLPPSAHQTPAVDGLLSITIAKRIADSVKTLINGINADPTVGDVSVFSRGPAERGPDLPNGKPTYTYPNPGVTQVVTGVSVGRVVDTQRRRRRSLAELPVAATT